MLTELFTFRFNLTALLTTNFHSGVRNVNFYLPGYRLAVLTKFSRKLHIAFKYDYLNLANFLRAVIIFSSQGIAEPVWHGQVREKIFPSTPRGFSVSETASRRMIISEYFKGLQKSWQSCFKEF